MTDGAAMQPTRWVSNEIHDCCCSRQGRGIKRWVTDGGTDRMSMGGRQFSQHDRKIRRQMADCAADRVGEYRHGWLTVWLTG